MEKKTNRPSDARYFEPGQETADAGILRSAALADNALEPVTGGRNREITDEDDVIRRKITLPKEREAN